MKSYLCAAAAAAALALAALPAQAQTADRTFETGPVWSIGYVSTKPGMFLDYMAYLNGAWRKTQEMRKQAGDVLDYKVLQVNSSRDNEPNLLLLIEYKNMAVFDRSAAEVDRQNAAVFGSNVKAQQAAASAEALRTQRGGLLTRELRFR